METLYMTSIKVQAPLFLDLITKDQKFKMSFVHVHYFAGNFYFGCLKKYDFSYN